LARHADATRAPRSRASSPADRTGGAQPAPLASDVQRDMEARFGHEFGAVRIWPAQGSVPTPQSLGADAYAVGDDLVFGPGAYAPDTADGRLLLAHELAHVVQQSGAPRANAHELAQPEPPQSAAEHDATRAAVRALTGLPAAVSTTTPPTVACGLFGSIKNAATSLLGGGSNESQAPAGGGGAPGGALGAILGGASSMFGGAGSMIGNAAHSLGGAVGGMRGHAGDLYRSGAQNGRITSGERRSINSAQRTIGTMEKQLETTKSSDNRRTQGAAGQSSNMADMLTNLLKRYDDTSNSIIGNMKG
jgi:hypothetical protein